MPVITHALLYAGYAAVAAFVGIALSSVGGAGATASFMGGVSLFFAMAVTHAGLAAAAAAASVRDAARKTGEDITEVRAGHRELSEDLDTLTARVQTLDQAVQAVARDQSQSSSLANEMRLVDQIAGKLAEAMDARIEEVRRLAAPAPDAGKPAARGPIDIVREALNENRVELHLQPIVTLPQRKTVFYEGFTRLRDAGGRVIMPQEFIPAAEQAGLMGYIDNTLLFRCVHIVRKLAQKDRRIGIFCNLAPGALSDELFFPKFLELMRENADLGGSLLFEMTQRAYLERTGVEARAMAKLVDLGFLFSIDRVDSIDDIDLMDLERSGVRYVKADARVILEQIVERGARPRSSITRDIDAADVSAVFQRYGVEMIAERIESEAAVIELNDLDIGLAQGHLFGAARPIKESLMAETTPPPGFSRDAAHRA